jgi:hypothetical protein
MAFEKVNKVLARFDPQSGKYISREFQSYGLYLCAKLEDAKHKTLYLRLAKTTPRFLLDEALSFVLDSNANNKGALFMWKLKQLKKLKKDAQKGKAKSG